MRIQQLAISNETSLTRVGLFTDNRQLTTLNNALEPLQRQPVHQRVGTGRVGG